RLYQGNQVRVEITGRDLRPFMRVSFNEVQGRSFLIDTTKNAFVDLPELKAGVYDVILYDFRQEADRLPKALTIMPVAQQPTIDIELEGAFIGVDPAAAGRLVAGVKFPPAGNAVAEILSASPPIAGGAQLRVGKDAVLTMPTREVSVPATLRAQCALTGNADGTLTCTSIGTDPGVVIAPDAAFALPGANGWVRYQVRAVHAPASAASFVDARVRFVGEPELIGLLKAGDADGGAMASATSRHATLTRVETPRPLAPGEIAGAPSGVVASRAVDAMVRIPVDRVSGDWRYMNQPLKVGAPVTFETARYIVRGEIVSMVPPAAASDHGK
ncbi:MAG TPA: hypothetical protein VKD69_25060, partial [Vicinamibacterales bacterium]|nr:hypothetical protein [Vicinamibacterales bacterium]